MRDRLMVGVARHVRGSGKMLGLGSWLPLCLFLALATSTQLGWWHPAWGPGVRGAVSALLVVLSVGYCLLYLTVAIVFLRTAMPRDDRRPRRLFGNAALTALYALLAAWGATALVGHPLWLLFWAVLVVWTTDSVGVVALEFCRLRHRAA